MIYQWSILTFRTNDQLEIWKHLNRPTIENAIWSPDYSFHVLPHDNNTKEDLDQKKFLNKKTKFKITFTVLSCYQRQAGQTISLQTKNAQREITDTDFVFSTFFLCSFQPTPIDLQRKAASVPKAVL